jgi:predicted DNA-binding WGR domain protein
MMHSTTEPVVTVPAEGCLAALGFLRLVSVDPFRNRFRFYTFTCEPTLWGEWAIRCTWGRIGGMGRSRLAYLGHRGGVSEALQELLEHRRRRGYRVAMASCPVFAEHWPTSHATPPASGVRRAWRLHTHTVAVAEERQEARWTRCS